MGTRYKNIETITSHVLRRHRDTFVVDVNSICRNYSPLAGNGWLHHLSQLLVSSYDDSLQKALEQIDKIIIEGYRKIDLEEVIKLIKRLFLESLVASLKLSPFQTLMNQDEGKRHLLMIEEHLTGLIKSTLEAKRAYWEENIKISRMKVIWEAIKIVLGKIKL